MTARDYRNLAAAIQVVYHDPRESDEGRRALDALIHVLSCALLDDNPRFDGARFRAAATRPKEDNQ